MKNRKEYDSIGGINVPVDKYWGASTQRSSKYFNIGDFLVRPIVIKSICCLMRENYYWILVGIAAGLLIYLGDKYIFW